MTAEQEVKKIYSDAEIRYCLQRGHYGNAVFCRCPDLKAISGVHNAPSRAWADALRRIKEAKSDPLQ